MHKSFEEIKNNQVIIVRGSWINVSWHLKLKECCGACETIIQEDREYFGASGHYHLPSNK